MTDVIIALYGILAAISTAAGLALGAEKRRGMEGFFYGLLFGPLGLILVAALEPAFPINCPYCRMGVPAGASRCWRCCADLPPVEVAPLAVRGGGRRAR
jgi:hypothetical protein